MMSWTSPLTWGASEMDHLLGSETARADYLGKVAEHGLRISTLNANGNQLHPVSTPAQDAV